jgi:31-O-methyltransferase
MTEMRSLPNGASVVSLNRNETDYLYREIFEDEVYVSPAGLNLPPRPTVFDVGANIGLFTLYALRAWPEARVFAFEPVPQIFDALRENLRDSANVSLHNTALGDVRQARELTFYPRYTMMSGFHADPVADHALARAYVENAAVGLDPADRDLLIVATDAFLVGRFEPQSVTCAVERLSDLADAYAVDRIDLLKIDVEGHELQVLHGIDESLWPRVDHAAVEVADRTGELTAVRRLFGAHGMRTSVRQLNEYCGTNLFMVFADRA